MKAYWHYRCDFGHTWAVFRDMDAPEIAEHAICPSDEPHNDPLVPSGREAVTLSKEPLIDAVQIAIRPAARIVDRVTNQIGHEYEFYLVITDLHGAIERQSQNSLTWEQLKNTLDDFRNVSAEKAWAMLDDLDKQCITK